MFAINHTRALRWRDVDPAVRPFDPALAREAVRAVLAEHAPLPALPRRFHLASRNPEIARFTVRLERALVDAYGIWALGWQSDHSDHDVWETLASGGANDRVTAVLVDWREWLETLARAFAAIDAESAGLALAPWIERAAARILPLVVAERGSDDAWWGPLSAGLAWYLERIAPEQEPLRWISDVVGGQFESWVEPSEATASRACLYFGAELAGRLTRAVPPIDALAQWRDGRSEREWKRFPRGFVSLGPARDGHALYIDTRDRRRDPERADRMHAALAHMRAAARRGEPLTMALLASCQQRVLGSAAVPEFRTGDAFAKGGQERYSLGPDTEAELSRCLLEANGPPADAVWRAARVYLDVCFFHPFVDGNARAARLALDHVLTGAGLTLDLGDPVFAFPRWAANRGDHEVFTWTLEQVSGPLWRPRGA